MSIVVTLKEQDIILNHKDVPFEQKIVSIIKVWGAMVTMDVSHIELKHVVHAVDWAILHTLVLVLDAEWNRWQDTYGVDILEEVERAKRALAQQNCGFNSRCEKVVYVLKNLWSHPVLMRVMRMENVEIGQDVIDLFRYEETHLISIRVNKLCGSRCEDLALNLVKAYFNTLEMLENGDSMLNASRDQISFIFDIRLVLLYKFKHRQELQLIVEELDFKECLSMVERLTRKRDFLKIWKYSSRTAMFVMQTRINKLVDNYGEESSYINNLNALLGIYIDFCSHDSLLHEVCRYLQHLSFHVNSTIIYMICETIHNKHGQELRSFAVELFIRGLTCDMNELEKLKLDNDSADSLIELSRRLASTFGILATILEGCVEVARECLLTAFSLDPTKEFLDRIEDMARRSGFQVTDKENEWTCKLHPPVLPSDEIAWKCPDCHQWMCQPVSDIALGTNIALKDAIKHPDLNLPETICDDLVICLSNPRYHILNWSLPWDVLHRLCIMYFRDPSATKNFVTELKFVDIDYSMFDNIKKEPVDEFAGIEKGFENYLDNYHSLLVEEEIAETKEVVQTLSESTTNLRDYSDEGVSKESPSETVDVDVKRKESEKGDDGDHDPNALESLRKYLRSGESNEETSSTRKTAEVVEPSRLEIVEKNHSDEVVMKKVFQTSRNHGKKFIKKKKTCGDDNYDPNSLKSLKKYLKSKQLKEEISSTRKYYKKSHEKAQFYNTRTGDSKIQVGSGRSESPGEEKTDVVDNVEKCLQSFIEGEDYDPNSIESLRKCVDLEKSKEKILSKLRRKSVKAPRSILRSDIPNPIVSRANTKRYGTKKFEYDCWSESDGTTKKRYEYLEKSRCFTIRRE